jgi:hypothetical protein
MALGPRAAGAALDARTPTVCPFGGRRLSRSAATATGASEARAAGRRNGWAGGAALAVLDAYQAMRFTLL